MAEERLLDQVPSGDFFRDAVTPEPAEPAAAEPAAPEPPIPQAPPSPEPTVQPDAQIPSWRLREEAEGRRQAEDRARQLEARLNEIAAHMQQNQKQPDFFENPDAATQALIMRTLQPYADQTRRELMFLGKMVASTKHGEDKVNEAEQAFLKARSEETLDNADYERVVTAANRYDEVVKWHKRQSVLSSVGDDPAAWFEKQLEARLADPKFQAQLMEKVRGDAAGRPPITKLPPSLSRSTAAKANTEAVEGDLSDQSLFAFATKR